MNNPAMPMAQSIALRLEQMILEGIFAPEQKMPSERQLSSQMGISRSIVREALHELHGRGVIETRKGVGSFVSKIVSRPDEDSPLMHMILTHSRMLYDLFEVRAQLEGQSASLAALRANEKDQYEITKAFNAMERADPLKNADLDHAFHQAIARASHNPVLVHVLASLKELMLHSVKASVLNLSHRKELKQQIDKHHRQLYNAIISRQSEWAEKAAIAHVKHVSEALKQIEKDGETLIQEELHDPHKS